MGWQLTWTDVTMICYSLQWWSQQENPCKKVLLMFCTRKGNEEKGEVVWKGGKFVVCCVFLHNKYLILMRNCYVTEGCAIINGWGRIFVYHHVRKKNNLAFTWIHRHYCTPIKKEFNAPCNRLLNNTLQQNTSRVWEE